MPGAAQGAHAGRACPGCALEGVTSQCLSSKCGPRRIRCEAPCRRPWIGKGTFDQVYSTSIPVGLHSTSCLRSKWLGFCQPKSQRDHAHTVRPVDRLFGGDARRGRGGLPYHSPHKFRHGQAVYALNMAKNTAALKAVSWNLMHSNLSITDVVYGMLPGSRPGSHTSCGPQRWDC